MFPPARCGYVNGGCCPDDRRGSLRRTRLWSGRRVRRSSFSRGRLGPQRGRGFSEALGPAGIQGRRSPRPRRASSSPAALLRLAPLALRTARFRFRAFAPVRAEGFERWARRVCQQSGQLRVGESGPASAVVRQRVGRGSQPVLPQILQPPCHWHVCASWLQNLGRRVGSLSLKWFRLIKCYSQKSLKQK